MTSDPVHFWLWVVTVATALIGGILSLWGAAMQRKDRRAGKPGIAGYRVTMASYGFMTASMVIFAARGFL